MRVRATALLALPAIVVMVIVAVVGPVGGPNVAGAAAPSVPRFSHVVEVFLENETATATWEDPAHAPNLAKLRTQGVYVPNFYGVGHVSLDNYEAAFGAVEPTAQGKADCLGMPYGTCIFPATVPTIATLLDEQSMGWKVYSEGEDGAPGGHPCLHAPSRNVFDPYQGPGTNGYATRHNPAPWFDSILMKGGSEAYCQAHSIDLTHLDADLASPASLPAFSFVEPDTCHDGHDTQSSGGCALDPEGPGAPSGVAAIDAWLPGFVQHLTTSAAWDDHSVLFITFDEGSTADATGCKPCADTSAGGRIGALVISPLVKPGTTSTWQGDHYGFLRTLESAWGLPTLKSRAASPAAAATVHDGDANVTPLTDVWTASASPAVTAAPKPAALAPASPLSGAPPSARGRQLASTGRDESPLLGLVVLATALVIVRFRRTRRPNASDL